MLVIRPDECIDCGACESECPAEAIFPDRVSKLGAWLGPNAKYAAVWPNIPFRREPPSGVEWCSRQVREILFARTGRKRLTHLAAGTDEAGRNQRALDYCRGEVLANSSAIRAWALAGSLTFSNPVMLDRSSPTWIRPTIPTAKCG